MKNLVGILLFALISTNLKSTDFSGHWKGNFILHGSGWPMRLHITQNENSVEVFLDLPNLVYHHVSVPASIHEDTLKVEFPFGLGTVPFVRTNDRLVPFNKWHTPLLSPDNPPPYRVEEISWKSKQSTLKGSIYIPADEDSSTLVICLHGSSIGSREHWEYRSWADYFARKKMAALVFDRRGEGESENTENNNNFTTLAEDVVNLISTLKAERDMSQTKILLFGGSQAAYIAFLVNDFCEDIDFMILSAASSVSVVEQERLALMHTMRQSGEPEEQVDQALAYQMLYFHYAMTGNNWKALEEAAQEAMEQPWGKYVDQPLKESDMGWWRHNYNAFQPQKLLPKIKIPLLLIYGAEDKLTPPVAMSSQFHAYFEESSKENYKIVICPDAGHSVEVETGYNRWGQLIWPQKSPVEFEAIENWLKQYGLTGN